MDEIEKNRLVQVYDLVSKEEQHYIRMHQSSLAFYMGIISALFAGTIAGLIGTKNSYIVYLLLSGPVIAYYISKIAEDGTFRFYQRFLETVTIKAKIEHKLGYDSPNTSTNGSGEHWLDVEMLIPQRYVEARKRAEYKTSQDFIDAHVKAGAHKWALKLLSISKYLSIILFFMILLYAIFFDKLRGTNA